MPDNPANPLENVTLDDLLAELTNRCANLFLVADTEGGEFVFEWHGDTRAVIGAVELSKARLLVEVLPKPTLEDIV